MSFAQLNLSPEILKAVSDQGYTEPTPIQAQAIPPILAGKDLMGAAQTGTGKTAGFTLPMLGRLQPYANTSMSPARHPIRALILVPTRELAVQVYESVKTYGKYLPLKCTTVYGGVDMAHQVKDLRAGVEILVATPGRLLDHAEQKTMSLSKVEILVLDEADRMLDMGFLPDIKRIIAMIPPQRQSLLFSATFSEEIKKLANKLLKEPALIEVARRNSITDLITHVVYQVARDRKRELLTHLIRSHDLKQVLIFVRTKHGASRLAQQLEKDHISATAIHGDKTQPQRIQALTDFKQGKVRALVATDVAARGLDIEDLPYVVNFELPTTPEDYIHRIGRTGRAGTKGNAISLASEDEGDLLEGIERLLKFKLKTERITGFEQEMTADGDVTPGTSGNRKRRERSDEEQEFKNRQAKPSPGRVPEALSGSYRSGPRNHKGSKTSPEPGWRQGGRSKIPEDPLFSQPYVPSGPVPDKTAATQPLETTAAAAFAHKPPDHLRNRQQSKVVAALFMPPARLKHGKDAQ
ncbi:MAG TPA: DEAD/DEAH box helicase [Nitrosospira sp.]|nr:DEAD/DEAH box helicase [Nitrosospira sp.]